MTDKPLIPAKTDTFEASLGVAVSLGEQQLITPRGPVRTQDAPGYATLLVDHRDPDWRRIALLLYAPGHEGAEGIGMIAQMTPTEARTIAASLLRLATQLDPGKSN